MKILCGCGMNVQAKEAANVEGYWLDLNLSASDGSYEEVESYISDIVSTFNFEQNEKEEEDTNKSYAGNTPTGL